jgi:hypothetical protein
MRYWVVILVGILFCGLMSYGYAEEGNPLRDLFTGPVDEEDLPAEEEVVPPASSEREPPLLSADPVVVPPTEPGDPAPFLSRPPEWDVAPPTVQGMPSLPDPTSFSPQEQVALRFVEGGTDMMEQENLEGARERFERAISIAPTQPYSYYFLGRLAFAGGDHKLALAFLQRAELLFAHSDSAWLGETARVEGTVYEDLGEYENARIAYQRSLQFVPTNLKVLSALARLPEAEAVASEVFPP